MHSTLDIDSYLASDSANIDNLVDDLLKNKIKLDFIFEKLEPYLIASETQKRVKSIRLISKLIQHLPDDYLNQLEVQHLTKFLCSKFEDHFSISPIVLPALEHIIRKNNKALDAEHAIHVIKSILRDIHVQSLVQSDRYIVYSICEYYLCQHVNMIVEYKCEMDFIYGFIQAMDAEKDPRNLVICFRNIVTIAERLDLGNFVEDMFEVFSCYFPIDFQTPANEANITKESLIGLLRRCFASSTKFAKYTIPLLLDKLNSDIDSAKLDSLLTYIDCATRTYDIDTYKEYIEPLWTCFQKLTMSTTSAAIEDACLKAIECLTVSVAKCMHKEGTLLSLDSFINKCIDCTLVYLKDADLKLIWPSAKCLQAISNATSTAHLIVLKTVVKFLLDKLNECKSLSQKRTYCEILWRFVSISHKYSTKAPVHIDLNRQSLLDLCFGMVNGANDKTVWQSALCGFYNLIYFDHLVDNTEFIRIFDLLMYRFAEFGSVTTVGNADQQHDIKLIVKIIMLILNKPDGFSYDLIFNRLQQTLFQSAGSLSALLILNEMSMASAYIIPILRQDTLTRVSNKIFELVLAYLAKAMATRDNIDECLSICSNLIEFDSMADKSFYELFDLVLSGLTDGTKPNDKQHMANFAGILSKFCVRAKTLDTHKQIVEKLDAQYGLIFSDNNVNDTDAYCGLVLYMQAFGSLDNRIFKREIDEFLFRTHKKLHDFAVSARVDSSVRLLATQFLATLINKHSDDLDFLAKQILTNEFIHSLSDRIQTCSDVISHLQMWIWLTKALVLRAHGLGEVFTSKLVEWLEWSPLSNTCSDGFLVILKEYDHVLNRSKTNARVKLFYRQHFFEAVATKLKTQFGVCSMELKPSYVNALLTTVNFLPKIILEQQLTSMLPILVFSLSNCNNDTLKLCSLKSIIDLFNNKPSQSNPLDDYTDEILCHLYELAKYKPNMEIRLLAIECLVKMADLNPTHVIKYQRSVIKHLEICLDDTKRLVRQKAVVARNKWCLLSTKADT